jgi:hypothetical protein
MAAVRIVAEILAGSTEDALAVRHAVVVLRVYQGNVLLLLQCWSLTMQIAQHARVFVPSSSWEENADKGLLVEQLVPSMLVRWTQPEWVGIAVVA